MSNDEQTQDIHQEMMQQFAQFPEVLAAAIAAKFEPLTKAINKTRRAPVDNSCIEFAAGMDEAAREASQFLRDRGLT